MATLRIRVELQRSEKGVEMAKLAQLGHETLKLLEMIAQDIGARADEGFWRAQDFYNQGVGFDAVYELADLDLQQVREYNHAIDAIATVRPENNWMVPGLRQQTVAQAAQLAKLAEVSETIRLGIYESEDAALPEWKPLKKDVAVSMLDYFNEVIEYRGMLQGVIHALYKESTPPFFKLRDFQSGELIQCQYRPQQYDQVYRALERRNAVVMVAGWICTRRLDRTIVTLKVDKIQATTPLNEEELRSFFGSTPGWTGDLTTDQFIESMRNEFDGDE